MEKGKDMCSDSPTLNEEWINEILGKAVCRNGNYDEGMVRDKVKSILVFADLLDMSNHGIIGV